MKGLYVSALPKMETMIINTIKLMLVSNYPCFFLSKDVAYGFATIKGFSQTEASGATSN